MPHTLGSVRVRIKILTFVSSFIVLYIVVRFAWVQVVNHKYYTRQATNHFNKKDSVEGYRGRIFDRHGYLLVGNESCFEISCEPRNLPQVFRAQTARIFAKYFGKPATWYYQKLGHTIVRRMPDGNVKSIPAIYLLLSRRVSPEVKDAFHKELDTYFKSVVRENFQKRREARKNKEKKKIEVIRYPRGFIRYTNSSYRIYPKRRLAANVLGYVNIDRDKFIPQSGLEKQLDQQISPDSKVVHYDLRDGKISPYDLQKKFRQDGKDVYLTISEPIQAILEEELDAAFEKWRPETIYAAVADPATGEILALAQRPTFDPNDRSTFVAGAARNRLVEDSYEPGSVIKPFTVAKALDWKIINAQDEIDCEKGRWTYLGVSTSDSHAYDKLDISGVIQKSSNIGTAKIALQLGTDRVMNMLRLFRFGESSGLKFAYESSGRVVKPRAGDGISITRYSFGYGIRVSPLQLIRAYSGLASPAGMPDLKIISKIVDPSTGKEETIPSAPPKKVFENENIRRQLVDMMITVTQPGGTAKAAAVPGYYVAGKTGTSRKFVKGAYSYKEYYASFVGFVPAKNPRLVMLVTFDNPKGANYGGVVSGPVFSRTAERILRYWNVPQDFAVPAKK